MTPVAVARLAHATQARSVPRDVALSSLLAELQTRKADGTESRAVCTLPQRRRARDSSPNADGLHERRVARDAVVALALAPRYEFQRTPRELRR